MNILDWIIIAWLVIAFLGGARSGFIFWAGSVIGLGVGIYVAGMYYDELSAWLGTNGWSSLAGFVILIVMVTVIGGIIAKVLNKFFNFIRWIPFVQTANRLLGAIIATIVNALCIAIILYFASHVEINPILTQTIAESRSAALLLIVSELITWLLPAQISELESLL